MSAGDQKPGVIGAGARLLRVLDALWPHAAHGLSPSEIADAARESRSYVTRSMHTLAVAGYAEQLPETNRWRVSTRVARLSTQYQQSLTAGRDRIEETQKRTAPTDD